jgi:glycosyltransferase involved in cell wall biosynthesis
MTPDTARAPLLSVIWNVRGRPAAARRNIAALQSQPYENFELLLRDDASNDEIRKELGTIAANDSRIRLVLPTTTNSGETLLHLLRHCRGDYIAICPSEGHFSPDALQFAVGAFAKNQDLGIVCGEQFLIDAYGKSCPDVDAVTLLFTPNRPFLPAGFFRRQALIEVGLNSENWLTDAIELELCLRLALDFGIRSFRQKVVECHDPTSQHDGLSRSPSSALDDLLQLLAQVFSSAGFWGPNEALSLESRTNQVGILWQQLRSRGANGEIDWLAVQQLRSIAAQFDVLLRDDHRVLRNLHRLFCTRSHNLGLLSAPLQKIFAFASRQRGRAAIHIPYQAWNAAFGIGSWLKRKVLMLTLPQSDHHPAAPPREEMLADLYAAAAARYEARGQIDIALEMWERAAPLRSADIDSLSCQALLRLPNATDGIIASFQSGWVQRHVGQPAPVTITTPNVPEVTRRIRVGYHCSFMHGDTIRFMMRDVIRAHDRTRFEIYGYSPHSLPSDIESSFDVVRNTAIDGSSAISDDQFVALVRSDEIDVLVELTGFSMGNRFVAMSRRCAPAQVSFLNHTGSSHVPNVDYIFSDEIGTPQSDDAQYSEQIERLPRCFFCFDYRNSESPPIVEPPVLARGYPTFGCFGYGGKLNKQLIALWARLLRRVPDAKLHLQNPQFANQNCRQFIVTQFRNLGIESQRLILARGAVRKDLLEVYNHIDISLDTWPYCGGNTIAESLWMGVPVVTLKGDRFSSRYGASLLAAAGCQDLVSKTPEQYIEIIAQLAGDLPRLRFLRQNLRQMSLDHGLGDSQRFALDLEHAYVEMLRRVGAQQHPNKHVDQGLSTAPMPRVLQQ